jgi:AraC family transcriptional regulator, regulatory protein of adaptative response / methylated-DNA-[protein]-cysteine methyltransferase
LPPRRELTALLLDLDLEARTGSAAQSPTFIFSAQASLKESKMCETIRFAWGISSLGDFMVAISDKGLVALEFSSHRSTTEASLRARFPEVDVIDGQEQLTSVIEMVGRAVEAPGLDYAITLDLRGTPFEVGVWLKLLAIPAGETTNYGAVAAKLGTGDARKVTEAIASNPIAVLVPCHRVIKKYGSISGYRWGFKRKRELLAREICTGSY